MSMGATRLELYVRIPIQNPTNRRRNIYALQHVMDGNRLRCLLRPNHAEPRSHQQPKIRSHEISMPNPREGLTGPAAPRENSKRSQQQTLPHRGQQKHTVRIWTRQRVCHTLLGRHNPTNHLDPRKGKKRQCNELFNATNHLQNMKLLRGRQKPDVHPRLERINNSKRQKHRPHDCYPTANPHRKIRTPRIRHRWLPPTLQMPMVRHRMGLE
jgi:hypothetical protein